MTASSLPAPAGVSALPENPLEAIGLAEYARRFRAGDASALATTEVLLARIEALDARLDAFNHVARERALATARAIDALRDAGTDLGPVMGIPVAVKDIFAVEGLPLTVGSHLDLAPLVGPQGPVVTRLRRQGCIVLGMTRTVECAFGATGINLVQGTSWNPWDAAVHRLPGGSSAGSAVAVAAGLCGFALGTDTGGSVRIPAALTGCAGMKTSVGRWPTDGISVLSHTMDTAGVLAPSVADAALAFAAVESSEVPEPLALAGLRVGVLRWPFLDDPDGALSARFEAALAAVEDAGARLETLELPELAERLDLMPTILSTEFVAWIGRERLVAGEELMDPTVWRRGAAGLDVTADRYQQAIRRREELVASVHRRIERFDILVSPSMPFVAPPLPDPVDVEAAVALAPSFTQNSQPANMFDLCALTLPLPGPGLPQGLQVMAAHGRDVTCMRAGLALEALLGRAGRPDLSGFAGGAAAA